MAIDFPNSPTNGQTTTVGNTTYVYNSTVGAWEILSSGGIGTMTTKGDLLSRSTTGLSRVGVGANDYVLTADSAQTAGVGWGAAPKVVSSSGTRPTSPYEGQLIYQSDTDQLLVWSGTAWVGISKLDAFQIDSSGRTLKPLNPFFFARAAGGNYSSSGTIPYTGEEKDIGNNYNSSTSVFTAPVNGAYQFNAQFFAYPSSAGGIDLLIGGAGYRYGREFTDTSYEGYSVSVSAYMTAGQTAYIQWFTGTVHTNNSISFFSGYLIG